MSIIVRPINATLTRDTDFFTKMDPYCKIYLGGQCQQTNICHNGGQSPTWNSTLSFSNSGDMTLRVEVWDYDQVGNNDLVGIGNLNLMNATQQGYGNSVWVDLFYNGRNAGRVCLSIQMNNMGMGMNMGMGGINMIMGVNPTGMNPMGMNPMGMNPMGGGFNSGFNGGYGGNPMGNNGWNQGNNGWGGW